MFLKPKWFNKLPCHLKPVNDKIKKLEALRVKLKFSHDLFMIGIANSRWALIKAQVVTLENLKKNMPNTTDKELWRGVLVTRFGMKAGMQGALDSLPQFVPPSTETIDKIMAKINSFEDLINFILSIEQKNLMDSDPIQGQIDEALMEVPIKVKEGAQVGWYIPVDKYEELDRNLDKWDYLFHSHPKWVWFIVLFIFNLTLVYLICPHESIKDFLWISLFSIVTLLPMIASVFLLISILLFLLWIILNVLNIVFKLFVYLGD